MISKILLAVVIVLLLLSSEIVGYRLIRSGLEWQDFGDMTMGLLFMLIPLVCVFWILGM